MTNNNPVCTHCDGKTRKAGIRKGNQRYRCYVCNKTHTKGGRAAHRPTTGKALTHAERQARYTAKKKKAASD